MNGDDNVPVATPALTPSSGTQPPPPSFGLGTGTPPPAPSSSWSPELANLGGGALTRLFPPPSVPSSFSPLAAAQQIAAQYGGPPLQGTPTEAMSGPSWDPEAAAQQSAYQHGEWDPEAAARQTAAQYAGTPRVRRAQLVAAPPSPTPSPTPSGNFNAVSPNLSGLATNFGHDINGKPDQYMLGKLGASSRIGAFGKDVTNPNLAGVSLPIKTINTYLGDYRHNRQVYKDIASGRYQVRVSAPNGNTQNFPIVDVGPGPQEPGAIDMTGSAYNQLGVKKDFNANFQIIDTTTGLAVSPGGGAAPASSTASTAPASSTAQADTVDESDPMYHWPEA